MTKRLIMYGAVAFGAWYVYTRFIKLSPVAAIQANYVTTPADLSQGV